MTVSADDLLYLVKLADWCAGQGFCQIDGIEDPEEWCYRKWSMHGPTDGDGYSAEALAAAISAGLNEASPVTPCKEGNNGK